MARRGGLGRGLGALIPAGAGDTIVGLQEIPVASVTPNSYQPREHFDEEALAALAASIREIGVLQPILVRPKGDGFELIAGERRWRASRRAGLTSIPALIRDADDTSALEQALVENVHRSDLNPLEEAAAYQQLIEDFKLTHEEVATRVGRSRAAVSNMLRLLQLPPSIQRALRDGEITMGHARALLGSPDRAFQEQLARRIVAEGLSVRAVEDAIRERGQPPDTQPSAGAATPRSRLRPPGILELEELLGELLATRVKIAMGGAKGKIQIEFAGVEDLERIYRVMTEGSSSAATGTAG